MFTSWVDLRVYPHRGGGFRITEGRLPLARIPCCDMSRRSNQNGAQIPEGQSVLAAATITRPNLMQLCVSQVGVLLCGQSVPNLALGPNGQQADDCAEPEQERHHERHR